MILMKDIIQEGHPTLRKRAVDVTLPISKEDAKTLRDMMNYVMMSQIDELVEQYGLRPSVGLAAPQVGISKKMFVMHTYDELGETLHSYAAVNPKIISYSEEKTYVPGGEGCLSVDEEKNGLVARSKRIRAKVTLIDLETLQETPAELKLNGYAGIVFQHEYDHLLGILFVDKKVDSLPGINPVEFKSEEIVTE